MAESKEIGRWIERTFRLILAVFFIAAGVLKIMDPRALTTAIETYQLLPYELSFLMALYMPWLEVFAGLGVLFKKLYQGSLLMLLVLLFVFLIALLQGWVRGLDVICGCFGNADHENQTNYGWLIVRDIFLLVSAYSLWIRQAHSDKQL